jgi:hypothetical protein
VDGARVEVFTSPDPNAPSFGNPGQVIAASGPGVHPTEERDVAFFEVNVTHKDFFAAHQVGLVQSSTGNVLPKLIFGRNNELKEQELPSYHLTAHTHDGIIPVVELYVAMGRLIDISKELRERAEFFRQNAKLALGKSAIGFMGPVNHEIRIFGKETLLAADASKGPFSFEKKILRTTGTAYFASWKPTEDTDTDTRPGRNMVAIYDPSTKFVNRKPRQGLAQDAPINFHVFFHPSTSWFPDPGYATGPWWLDFVSRYVYGQQRSGGSKAMANQVFSSGKLNTVLIFPVGSGTRWHNDLLTQEAVMRLVHEVSYFIQRKDGDRYPLQPVGAVGISWYSSAASFAEAILKSPAPKYRSGASIREAFDLDGRIMVNNRVSEPGMVRFAALLRKWLLDDMTVRAVRSYSQLRNIFDALQDADSTVRRTNANGCLHVHSPSITALHAPIPVWSSFFSEPFDQRQPLGPNNPPTLNQGAFKGHGPDMPIHDIIPAWFLEHALSVARHD